MNASPNSKNNLPANDAWRILLEANPPAWVLRHSAAVARLAVAMARLARQQGHPIDIEIVHAGAILHDVGRSITQDVRHASLGADLLREHHNIEANLTAIVERHTGGGIDAQEARKLGLPERNYIPHTLEEKLVCHADNLYAGDKRVTMEHQREKYLARDLASAWTRIEALHTEITAILGIDPQEVEPAQDIAEPELPA